MKNKCKVLFILVFVITILFYRFDSVVAMAAEENIEPELIEEPIAEAEAEPVEESVAEPELEQESFEEPVTESESEQKLIEEFAAAQEPEQTISSGPALMEWLEAHKNIGGTIKLADHVVLDGEYSFCPNGINRPAVFVDTDKYTITVTGETELFSDNHLIFSGQPDGKSIFCVAEKGMLSMQGVTVESVSCALWQEESAGLVISDCRISGSVHYADTPFVIYQDSDCVIVEEGQTLNDVLPAQIRCTVNRWGQVSNNEWVPLSWNLEGTEKQQEERRRFGLQGSFLYAASAKPPQCTVVYNDYPLTFTDVKASVSGSMYTFRGWYTKPEKALPITVISEYSFDGESWLTYEETKVTDAYAGFFMAITHEQRDRAAYPNIYIRLQWNDNGTGYYSNVLCYMADNLEVVEDIGGSRGGGTSIINPPDKPQKSTGSTSAKNPTQNDPPDTNSNNVNEETLSGTDQTKKKDSDSESGLANDEQSTDAENSIKNTELSGANVEQPIYTETSDSNKDQSLYTETIDTGRDQALYAQVQNTNEEQILTPSQISARTLHADTRQSNHIIIVLGFVLFSVIAGAAGFYVHSRSGTNR